MDFLLLYQRPAYVCCVTLVPDQRDLVLRMNPGPLIAFQLLKSFHLFDSGSDMTVFVVVVKWGISVVLISVKEKLWRDVDIDLKEID